MLLEEAYKEYLSYSKEKLVEIATENAKKLTELGLKVIGNSVTVYGLFIVAFSSFIGVDGVVTDEEYELFKTISGFDITRENFDKLASESSKQDVIERIDMIVDANEEAKQYVVAMGLAICAIDGEISIEEKELIEKYFTDYSLTN